MRTAKVHPSSLIIDSERTVHIQHCYSHDYKILAGLYEQTRCSLT